MCKGKWVFWVAIFTLSLCSSISAAEEGLICYEVKRHDYPYSSVFEMTFGQEIVASALKSPFHMTTQYDLYNSQGVFEGKGVCRLLSLGVIYSWGTEIDIYDEDDNYIGMIDGLVATSEPAKFCIYNCEGKCIGIAYLDKACTTFTIIDPNYPALLLAKLTRNFIDGHLDNWRVEHYEPLLVGPKVIQIFASFACDSQGKFIPNVTQKTIDR